MKKLILPLAIAATALLLGGCLPEESIWWSPDGQIAAIRTADGLRLASADGHLSALVLTGEVQSAAWLPDGSGLVVNRTFRVTDWPSAQSLIPAEEAAATRALAATIPDLLKAGLTASGGSLDDIEQKFLTPLGFTASEKLLPVVAAALALHGDQIRAVIAGFPTAKKLEAELFAETNGIPIHEISILPIHQGQPAGEPRAVVRSLHPLLDPVVSPRHPVLALRTGEGALKAATLDGKTSLLVAEPDVRSAVWAADGRTLIHVVMAPSDKVGEIRVCTVVNSQGELVASPPAAAPRVETLALAAFNISGGAAPRLCVLPDGRLLFASVPVTLPATVQSIPPAARFFLLDPTKPEAAPVPVTVPEGSLPADLNAFALSPDGRFVAVVEGGTDAVAVLELSTGKVEMVSPAHPGWKSRLIPAWRNNHELTFAALPSSTATRPELFLWEPGGSPRLLSKDWPEDVVKAWLEPPRADSERPSR